MNKHELCTQLENFDVIHDHIIRLLKLTNIDEASRSETVLVFEALYNDMIARGIPKDTPITVWKSGYFGSVNIRIQFKGKLYVPSSGDDADISVEQRIMTAFGDRIEQRYHDGSNYLTLVAKRSSPMGARNIAITTALAVLAFLVITSIFDSSEQQKTIREGVFQLEMLFTKAMLSIGAPVTFFSLLRNLTNMYILREGDSLMRTIQVRALVSSAIAVVLSMGAAIAVQFPMRIIYFGGTVKLGDILPGTLDVNVDVTLREMFQSIVSPNIFEPFETFSPFPIIVIAILTSYALCSAGNYFEGIKKVVDGCYVLFSKMLTVVMYMLPFFFFTALLEGMLREGPGAVLYALGMTVCMILLVLFYAVRLGIKGIRPLPFIKKMGPLIKENMIINSTIEAVPFNTRYCITKYGFDKKRAERVLPLLAQINLDGNCFIITLIAMMLMYTTGSGISWLDVAMVGLVIFFMSLGAPNQPGSILIGLIVIFSYMNALDIIALAIYSEAIFGSLLSAANAAGDIVTVAIEEKHEKTARSV